MNILVIGGAGYIGSVVSEVASANKNNIIIYDNFSTGFKESIANNYSLVEGDILDTPKLIETIEKFKIDIIIALAGKIIVPESVVKPLEYYEVNISGMNSILKAMVKTNRNKIIFSSTAAVYGECSEKPVTEDDFKSPINPYGESKLVCEWMLEAARKAHNINYIIFRFFNVAGASDSNMNGNRKEQPSSLIPAVLTNVLNNKIPSIFGNKYKTRDGTCLRDYIHVQDLADAHILAFDLLNKNKSNIFNLGSNKGYTVQEIVNTIKYSLNLNFDVAFKPPRDGDPASLTTNNKKAINHLKWAAKRDINIMIKSEYNFRKKLYDKK